MAETLKVLLVAVTAALQQGGGNGGDGGVAALMRVMLPLLIQVGRHVHSGDYVSEYLNAHR